MRRLITFVAVASVTAVALLHWLHDGDLMSAVQPVVAQWDAELLARNAGLGIQDAPETP